MANHAGNERSRSHIRISLVALLSNILLSAVKLYAGIITGSLAILSDALNSVTDILSSLSVFLALRVASKKPDKTHHYGHYTAEPLAGLIVSIFAGVVGFEVIKSGIIFILEKDIVHYSFVGLAAMIFSVVLKGAVLLLVRYSPGRKESPSLEALSVDYRNDILITLFALGGYLSGSLISPLIDFFSAMLLGLFILYSAFDIGRKNVMFLMGSSPPAKVLNEIGDAARSVKGVDATNDIFGHYFGNKVHAEVH
ncbi:cation transporter, partial [Candidatus Woesearchaeota archaeon]